MYCLHTPPLHGRCQRGLIAWVERSAINGHQHVTQSNVPTAIRRRPWRKAYDNEAARQWDELKAEPWKADAALCRCRVARRH